MKSVSVNDTMLQDMLLWSQANPVNGLVSIILVCVGVLFIVDRLANWL